MVPGLTVVPMRDMQDLSAFLRTTEEKRKEWEVRGAEVNAGQDRTEFMQANSEQNMLDFSQVSGQESMKRAACVAAAGFHHLLFRDRREPENHDCPEDSGNIAAAYEGRAAGGYEHLQYCRKPLTKMRPFQAPHHTISPQALAGGGRIPKPGVLSLAHRGILFLDEMPEFSANVLEVLRQPLEEKKVQIARTQGIYRYPAEFMLVCALNPCPCGYFPDRNRCRCTEPEIRHYLGKFQDLS